VYRPGTCLWEDRVPAIKTHNISASGFSLVLLLYGICRFVVVNSWASWISHSGVCLEYYVNSSAEYIWKYAKYKTFERHFKRYRQKFRSRLFLWVETFIETYCRPGWCAGIQECCIGLQMRSARHDLAALCVSFYLQARWSVYNGGTRLVPDWTISPCP
jgi:hypothetical protein